MGMQILYKNKTAEKQFSSKYKKNWKYPEQVKRKLRKGEWSIYLGNTGYRVTMIPCDDNGNEIIDGDIMAKCRMIKIVCITEVSNHYE